MTAYYPQRAVSSMDAYSNVPAIQPGLNSYRPPPIDIDLPSRPYVAEHHSIGGPLGVSLSEARQLYRQVYSSGRRDGLTSLELGHAAAYHAYYSSIRSRPLHGESDIELERENLIGLAIAEASRLNRQFGRDIDISTCTTTFEAAARTACRIFARTLRAFDAEDVAYSHNATDPYTNSPAYEDVEMIQRPRSGAVRGRSRSFTPHPTFADAATVIPGVGSGYNADRMSGYNTNRIPLNASYSDTPFPGSRYPPTPYPGSSPVTQYPSTPVSYTTSPYTGSGAMATSYPRTAPSKTLLPQVYQAPSYSGYASGTTIPASGRRSASSQPAYMVPPAQASYTNSSYGYPTIQPEQATVIYQPRKHRHRHHHRRRHHSHGR
ncbi:hypothetical protein Agabi119p4_1821 [Agaricus bisporus var. burnettii]|uniref:Uncharacterized protein n=1 Tax=Agaricus bisporus var. burnettii TaxID=192524 RepID=A0A8H7KJS8_AGABI|nr:hypothetical protein Agabi119p4_1821 [Agaricus bisporus var. burnettii]